MPASTRAIGIAVAVASVVTAAVLVFRSADWPWPKGVETSHPLPGTAGPLAQVTLKVDGMTCATCSYRVSKALAALSGVKKAEVSLERGQAVVTYEEAMVTVEQMINAIEQAGYAARFIRAGGQVRDSGSPATRPPG